MNLNFDTWIMDTYFGVRLWNWTLLEKLKWWKECKTINTSSDPINKIVSFSTKENFLGSQHLKAKEKKRAITFFFFFCGSGQ
jgi:hypothetical protein